METLPVNSKPAWGLGQVALGILLILAAYAVIILLSHGLGRLAGPYSEAVAIWVTSHLLGLAIFGIVWWLGLRPSRAPASVLGLKSPNMPVYRWAGLALAAFGASLGVNVAYVALINLTGLEILQPPEIPPEVLLPGLWVALTFQSLAVWTPITEEVFFRGFVFPGMINRWGLGRAIVASAAVFSVFHIDPRVMLPIFVTGILLAWLYHRTGSIWPPILAHAAQNALATGTAIYQAGSVAGPAGAGQ